MHLWHLRPYEFDKMFNLSLLHAVICRVGITITFTGWEADGQPITGGQIWYRNIYHYLTHCADCWRGLRRTQESPHRHNKHTHTTLHRHYKRPDPPHTQPHCSSQHVAWCKLNGRIKTLQAKNIRVHIDSLITQEGKNVQTVRLIGMMYC